MARIFVFQCERLGLTRFKCDFFHSKNDIEEKLE